MRAFFESMLSASLGFLMLDLAGHEFQTWIGQVLSISLMGSGGLLLLAAVANLVPKPKMGTNLAARKERFPCKSSVYSSLRIKSACKEPIATFYCYKHLITIKKLLFFFFFNLLVGWKNAFFQF